MGWIERGGFHGRRSIWAGPFVRFGKGKDSLGGKGDLNKSLEIGKACVASWKPQLTYQ